MKNAVFVFSLFLSCLLLGCGDAQPVDMASDLEHGKIHWFEGDIEQAFAKAKDAGRPVFLYWGAEWCPPCHNLKVNVFTQPEFLGAIEHFMPVYLDGDTERAQLWGEKFEITGYPTVILFSPTGVELFRMPTDVTVEQYGALLQAAISDFRPVHQVLSEVIASGPRSADERDLELIAYHSWAQDPHTELSDSQALETFWRLYFETPVESTRLRARFMALTLERAMPRIGAAQALYGEGSIQGLDDQQREALRSGLVELLISPDLWPENKIFLTLQSSRAIDALEPSPSPGRDELVEFWLSAAEVMRIHPEFSDTEQLMAFVPEFELLAIQDSESAQAIPEHLKEKVRARAEEITAAASDPNEFQSTLNMLVWLLTMAQLPDEAEALLDQYMDQTTAPHYFLSLLGDLTTDDPETALEWHRLAFERSGRGSARVKWGSAYVIKLIQLAPEDDSAIEEASRTLIIELAQSEDAFAGRNHAYLDQLDGALKGWAAATNNATAIEMLRTEVQQQCDRFGDQMDPVQYERCMTFLSSDDG